MGLRTRHAGLDSQRVDSRETRKRWHRHRDRWSDPQLISPKLDIQPGKGDVLEVRIAPSRTGEIQWFWRTETTGPIQRLSQEQSRLATVEGARNDRVVLVARPFWKTDKPIIGLRFDFPEGAPGVFRLNAIRVLRGSRTPGPCGVANTASRWQHDASMSPARPRLPRDRLPVTTPWPCGISRHGSPNTPGMAGGRLPSGRRGESHLLFDSSDKEMNYNGIQFYRASNRRVMDWHVHWMREHCVNLMLWDWYPGMRPDGTFDPTFFSNRALEIGFLGKEKLGGPAVATNRFAATMPFAIMWTNHAPANRLGGGLAEYIVDQFFVQPNYYKVDGKAFLPLWSPGDLVSGAGGETQAKAALDRFDSTRSIAAYRASTWSPSTGAFARANREAGDRWGHGLRGAARGRLDDRIPARG